MGKHSKSVKSQMSRLNASRATVQQENLSAEKLRAETDFANYLRKLKLYAQKYCVMVVACDTPWGPPFTQELTKLMMSVGFKENLYGKFRCPYSAVIEEGKLIFERLEGDITKSVDETIFLKNGEKCHLLSLGFNAGRRGLIEIGEIHNSVTGCVLFFVVYDESSRTVLDAVTFDSYTDLSSNHLLEYSQAIRSLKEEHPGVLTVGYCIPDTLFTFYTNNEKYILEKGIVLDLIKNHTDKPISILSRYYDKNALDEVLESPKSYYDHLGVRRYEDRVGNNLNIADGHRATAFQPDNTAQEIYILGDCRVFGVGNSDEHTIQSFLQKKLNNNATKVKVMNYGAGIWGLGAERNKVKIGILNSLPVKDGDIVLIQNPVGFDFTDMPVIDLFWEFSKPHTEDYYFDTNHFTPDGNRLIAEKLFEALTSRGILDKAQQLANVHFGGGGGNNPLRASTKIPTHSLLNIKAS